MKRFTYQLAIIALLCGGVVFGGFGLSQHQTAKDLVVHEWGTFTSIQGSDGKPLYWQSTNVAPLPSFVYDWNRPGLAQGWHKSPGTGGKGSVPMMVQRMETPVVYFYSPHDETVDVTVRFPQGKMTEWYPRADEVGPTYTTNLQPRAITEQMLHWPAVHVLATADGVTLPEDKHGSHYYAARETDSATLRVDAGVTNSSNQFEKFLFYRGVGSFNAPLKASMSDDATVTVENTGSEPLHDLFVLEVNQGKARLVHLKTLRKNEKQNVRLDSASEDISIVTTRISSELASALTQQNLYPRESAAMVKTWKDSWFEEEGIRVLYLLPRKWTDEILPMQLQPQPRELVRVMVGRAEVISPKTETELGTAVVKMSNGDFDAKVQVRRALDRAGRFSAPVLLRTLACAKRYDLWQTTHAVLSEGLVFDAKSKDYTAKEGEDEAHFTFKIANLSAREVVIERAQGTCGCTRATLPSQPWHLLAGESGDIPVTMILKGKPPGQIEKDIILFTSEGQRNLTVKTVIPAPTVTKTASLP